MLALAEGKMQKQDPAMQYLDKANELSAHLLSLINDILDMSRIEAGKVELENKPFSLRAMGDKLYDMFAKTLDARGIRYAVNFEGVTVDWLLGDELRLSQIMINFLSNAVKFTEQGEIVVTIRQMMLREGNVDLLLRVHDTGQGMDPNFVYRIFRPFDRDREEVRRHRPGHGHHRPAGPSHGWADLGGEPARQRLGLHRLPHPAPGGGRRAGQRDRPGGGPKPV